MKVTASQLEAIVMCCKEDDVEITPSDDGNSIIMESGIEAIVFPEGLVIDRSSGKVLFTPEDLFLT